MDIFFLPVLVPNLECQIPFHQTMKGQWASSYPTTMQQTPKSLTADFSKLPAQDKATWHSQDANLLNPWVIIQNDTTNNNN